MRLDEEQIIKQIKEHYGLSDEEIDEEIKNSKIRNNYSALVQLKNELDSNIDNEIITTLRRQVKIGRNLFAKGILLLAAIEVSKNKTIEINNSNINKILDLTSNAEKMINDSNINKILDLTSNAEKMINTGSSLEMAALEKIKALQK